MATVRADIGAIERAIIGDIFTSDETIRNLTMLCDDFGSRFGGTESERQASEFLRDKLTEYGCENVRLEPFEYGGWVRGKATLTMLEPRSIELAAIALPYCPAGELTAEVINVGEGEEEDFARLGDSVRGKIALSSAESTPVPGRRPSHRKDKFDRAVRAGAVAFLFANKNPGQMVITGSLSSGREAEVPGLGVSFETGEYIRRACGRGRTVLRLTGDHQNRPMTSWNVVGDIPGDGSSREWILFGGHYDGHDIAQGALDDGAGTVVGLEMARVLAKLKRQLPLNLRAVFWGVEELGLNGAWAYTRQHADELKDVRFVLNLDTAGRGPGGTEAIDLTGIPELVPYLKRMSTEMCYRFGVNDRFNSHSDHFPYAIRGVPNATLKATDPASSLVGRGWGHTPADTLDKADLRGLQSSAMVGARVIARMAAETDWPARHRTKDEVRAQLEANGLLGALEHKGRFSV